ncbi:LysR family transcriptional regulator [Lacisediminihabitans changchengi]|uniref:LysR family transcriptional regulator n=1 Tax=Lacisediminihabitans changchengi TaxID=2787634 RepID=A0A934SPE0_9MICO|nr:LysR family transcriptional regulator [Lacisediminihabitans changchengi]MBK4346613.1 LysR family transcriptional regulator [Lacisediminihabitans changchengi]
MDLDLHTVRIVRAIADSGSITGAARMLGYSQPAVSQHLQRAESRIGLPLVAPAGRTVRLTEAGQLLARHALAITSALDAAAGELADLAGLRSGTVRVAAFPTASSTIVPRFLAGMAERHPGVHVSYLETEPPEAIAMLREGAIDVAITFSYPGDRGEPDVTDLVVPLFTEELVVVLPAGHARAADDRVDVTRLGDERWIAGCPRCRGHLLAVCEAEGFIPRIGFETDNAGAVLSMVASGLGVAMLPRLALATAALPAGAVTRELRKPSIRSIQAVANEGAARVPALAASMSLLRALRGDDWGLTPS